MNWGRGTSFLKDQKPYLPKQLFPINTEPHSEMLHQLSIQCSAWKLLQRNLALLRLVQDTSKDAPGNLEL